MIISHSRRLIFIHIHKAGGTSVECALAQYLTWNDLIVGSTPLGKAINDHYRKRYGLDKHSSVSDIEKVCGQEILDQYYVFSVVRHPLDRLCSLYNFIGSIINKWATGKNISLQQAPRFIEKHPDVLRISPNLGWPSSKAFLGTRNFAEFIRDDRLIRDSAFRTQVSRLRSSADGALKGQIFRLEDRLEWLPKLSATLGLDLDLPHENKSELSLSTRQSVTPKDVEYIENHYAEDYAAFGYWS